MAGCQGCGATLPPNARKWCSERCRKNQYDLECIDCGARVDGTTPGRNGLQPRCPSCAAYNRERAWPREAIAAAMRQWANLYGEPPAMGDWDPWRARSLYHDEARARRFEDAAGRWPGTQTVVDAFGAWNAALVAAGFGPRAAHGGGGNVQRRRNQRAKAAA